MKYLKLLLITLLVASCQNKEKPLAEGKYRINGTVTGMETGNLFLISGGLSGMQIDTLKVQEGSFIYESNIAQSASVVSLTNNTNFRAKDLLQARIYIEPTILTMNLDMNDFENVQITGSKTQDDANKLASLQQALKTKYKKELDAFNANRDLFDKATTPEETKKLKWKDDDLRTALEPYYSEGRDLTLKFIKDNPESFVSFNSFRGILRDIPAEDAKAIYTKFPEEFKKGPTAERIEKDIADKSKGIPGALAGDFNTTDINGKPIKLSDFKGQYLLIDFWASWCVPCRKGNSHLLDLYAKYKSKGLEILGVSDDDRDHDAWRKAVKVDNIGVWRHVLRGLKIDLSDGGFKILDHGISDGYNISTLPTKILVGPDGVIVGRYGGGGGTDADMDKDLAKIFGS